MNMQNKSEMSERHKYYSIPTIPVTRLNATSVGLYDFDKLSKEPVTLDIELAHKLNTSNDSITINVKLLNYGAVDLPAMNLHVVIIENMERFLKPKWNTIF